MKWPDKENRKTWWAFGEIWQSRAIKGSGVAVSLLFCSFYLENFALSPANLCIVGGMTHCCHWQRVECISVLLWMSSQPSEVQRVDCPPLWISSDAIRSQWPEGGPLGHSLPNCASRPTTCPATTRSAFLSAFICGFASHLMWHFCFHQTFLRLPHKSKICHVR